MVNLNPHLFAVLRKNHVGPTQVPVQPAKSVDGAEALPYIERHWAEDRACWSYPH